MENKEITTRMSRRKLGLGNAKDDAGVMQSLAPYGYDQTKIDQGLQLIGAVEELSRAQGKEYGEQQQATKTFYDTWDAVKRTYNKGVTIARIEFEENTAARVALHLDGKRKEAVSGWLKQARAFYKGLLDNPEWLAKMAGYSTERLQTELAAAEQIEELDRVQEKETGEARESTKARDAKYDEQNQWWTRYVAYATAALEDQPQKLKLVTQGEI
jgi:hypothetical protein